MFEVDSPNVNCYHMISFECFNIQDFKGIQIQIVKSEQGQSVVDLKTKDKGLDKVCSLLQIGYVACVFTSFNLNISRYGVEPNFDDSELLYIWNESLFALYYLIWSWRCSTIGENIFSQFSFKGVYLFGGTGILRISSVETLLRLTFGAAIDVVASSTSILEPLGKKF